MNAHDCLEEWWPRIASLLALPPDAPLPRLEVGYMRKGGAYNRDKQCIVLAEDWKESDVIHEAVHHAQKLQGRLPPMPSYLFGSPAQKMRAHLRCPYEQQARSITVQLLGLRYMLTEEIPFWISLIPAYLGM